VHWSIGKSSSKNFFVLVDRRPLLISCMHPRGLLFFKSVCSLLLAICALPPQACVVYAPDQNIWLPYRPTYSLPARADLVNIAASSFSVALSATLIANLILYPRSLHVEPISLTMRMMFLCCVITSILGDCRWGFRWVFHLLSLFTLTSAYLHSSCVRGCRGKPGVMCWKNVGRLGTFYGHATELFQVISRRSKIPTHLSV
jgi:hypothetical protein